MFKELEEAKEVLRGIDEPLTLANEDTVRAKVRRAIELINQYENAERKRQQGG
jgi:hypothetical protein